MDFIWNRSLQKRDLLKNQFGQSTVEYILLFVVVVTIATSIFKSAKFNELFGKNGTIATTYKNQVEFSYRHGYSKSEPLGNVNYSNGRHKSYNGRFFSAKDAYP